MANDTDIDFRASELVTTAGSGSNGEKLAQLLVDFYPAGLQAAQLKRINAKLDEKVDDSFRQKVSRIAGGNVEQVHVRGGERRDEDAVVTYAFVDDRGEVWKGCLPYGQLDKSSPEGHISQRDSLAASTVAQAHIAEHPRQARQSQAESQQAADPFALGEMSAEELTALMDEHPDRVEAIKAFEKAYRGKRARKSVLEYGNDSSDASGDDSASSEGDAASESSSTVPGPHTPPQS